MIDIDNAKKVPFRITPVFKIIDNTLLLASVLGEGIYRVSGIGSCIWEHINGFNTVSNICDIILDTFDGCTEKQVKEDVITILNELVNKTFVVYDWNPLKANPT